MQLSYRKERAEETRRWLLGLPAYGTGTFRHMSILAITGISFTTTSTSGEFRNMPHYQTQRETRFHVSAHACG